MKGTGSILQWARQHSLEETMEILSRGKILIFNSQGLSSTDPAFFTLLNMAYVYCSIEEERMLEEERYVGYDTGFIPNKDAGVVWWIFECVADGMELEEITEEFNRIGFKDRNRKRFTVSSVKTLLTTEVYAGDYWFENQGVYIEGHHKAIVPREVWDLVPVPVKSENQKNNRVGTGY